MSWQVNKEISHESWLELEDKESLNKAGIRSDGCIHFYIYDCDAKDHDYIHICELDRLISQLTEMRESARKYFGEDWE